MKKIKSISYWSRSVPDVLASLDSKNGGLSSTEAEKKLKIYGENVLNPQKKLSQVGLFLNQFKNPIIIILLFATVISAVTGNWFDAQIILLILLASALLSFYQEYSAGQAIEKLRSKVQVICSVKRDGTFLRIPSRLVVPGDIVQLSGGDLIPADGLILESTDLYVNQSILTGESISVEKMVGTAAKESGIGERSNCVFMGTNVFSGDATIVVVETGSTSQYGTIAEQLTLRPIETDFEKGVRHFGYLLTQIMFILTLIIFAINVLLNKPSIDSLLFSIALAVGITPQLLPAIVSITLSSGARVMAKNGVIIRRLNAIENFGSMNVLCTDKTGTLTDGNIQLDGAVDASGQATEKVFRLAYLNAVLQKGMRNTLDAAIEKHKELDIHHVHKLGEVAFDFNRKRLSVLFREEEQTMLVTKGAFNSVLDVCDFIEVDGVKKDKEGEALTELEHRYKSWSEQGIRVLGVAQKTEVLPDRITVDDERKMTFVGFLLFSDHPKADAAATIQEMARKGVGLRIITGDNKPVALFTAESVGLKVTVVLTGKELQAMSDESLWQKVDNTNLFAEVDPNQKERIILALKKKSYVVGYMGDGINDVPAMHAADVAKESADIVLMEKSLSVLNRGIEEGRKTFSNTLKYIWVTTSANFGNMFSVAGISLLLPFFPLLPKQILLLNFITDFPALTLSKDSVDEEMLLVPQKWDIKIIREFMFTFGLTSSVFDYLITYILIILYRDSQMLFQSGWFIFSILTELVTLMIMRTHKPFYRSKPARLLLFTSLLVGGVTLLIPYTPLAPVFAIEPISLSTLSILTVLIALYAIALEVAKRLFYRRHRMMK